MAVPQGLAYAILAGVPPIYGLYSCTLPLIIYSILGTSGQIALGPVAMISLLTSGAISALPGVKTDEMTLILVHVLALLYGIASLVLGILGLGSITQFLSHEVLGGFTAAAAIIISFSQMKYVLGVKIARHHYPIETFVEVFSKIPETNLAEVFIAFLSMSLILALRYWKNKYAGAAKKKQTTKIFKIMSVVVRFSALVVVFVTSIVAAIMVASGLNINIVGAQPSGIPAPTLIFSSSSVAAYIPDLVLPAVTMAFIGFAETYAVGKIYDTENLLEPNRELVAIGIANIVGIFGRTAVNANAGSKSSLSNLFTGAGVILILLLLSPAVQYVPYSGLAAIIITSVLKLINIESFKVAWKVNRSDFAVLFTTLVATLSLGIEIGIAFGTAFSIVNIIRESASPYIAILGQVNISQDKKDEKMQWRDIARFPEAYKPPRNIVVRMDRSLFFPNCEFFDKFIMEVINKEENDATVNVVIDLIAVNKIDVSGLHTLCELQKKLHDRKVKLSFACGKGAVRDILKRWTSVTSHIDFPHYDTIEDALLETVGNEVELNAMTANNILLQQDELGKKITNTDEVKLEIIEKGEEEDGVEIGNNEETV
eukprot:g8315.t1